MAVNTGILSVLERDYVDEYADEFLLSEKKDVTLQEWEIKRLGASSVHRLKNIGRDAVEQRFLKLVEKGSDGLPAKEDPKVLEAREQSNFYYHRSGKEMMEMQLFEEKEQVATESMSTKAKAAVKLLRKKIKVSDNEEGGDQRLNIDHDWDTSTWKQPDIEAGMDYLLHVFVDPMYRSSEVHKKMAVTMIDKLLTRHWQAEFYLRDKLESIVSRAISRFIRNGRSAAQLNLLFILHVGRAKYLKELSLLNFAGRSFEMMSVEARLAAILIQHTWRTFRAARNAVTRAVNPITKKFGGDLEMRFLREAAVRARSKQLRASWAVFHEKQNAHERGTPSGFRGPCHMEGHFVTMVLEMTLSMVSPESGTRTQANREDLIASGSSVMLANFASYPFAPFSRVAIKICSFACKVARSMQPMLEAGVVYACVRYMNYLENMGLLQWIVKGRDLLPNRQDMSNAAYLESQIPKRSFFDCILIITRLAVHAAGCFRARDGYAKIVPATEDVEEIDYREVLSQCSSSFNASLVRSVLGQKKMLKALGETILRCNHLYCMRSMLLCYYAISCTEAQGPLMFEVVFDAGRIMERILSMIEEQDLTVATLAMCIFLQLATTEGARETFMCAYIPKYLGPFTRCTPPHYSRLPYTRAILINAALLRQSEWRSYDPEVDPGLLSSEPYMRNAVYLDLLKTTRNIPNAAAAKATIADLIVLPAHQEHCKDFSVAAEMLGARDIVDFLTHPGDREHTDRLPVEEAIAGCVIIHALGTHRPCAASIFSPDTILYLGRCLFIFRWMFAGAPLNERQLLMTFQGVRSTAIALRSICEGIHGDHQREAKVVESLSDLEDPARYFVGNLSIKQDELSVEVRELQRQAAVEVLKYLRCHVDIIERTHPHPSRSIAALESVGLEVLKVVRTCNDLYGDSHETLLSVLESCCGFLEVISQTEPGAKLVSAKWRSGASIKMHLPKPLSGVGPLGIDEAHYKTGLARMGPSLFRLLGNLCFTGAGKSDCLSDGFLRRSLDKFDILYEVVIDEIDVPGIGGGPVAIQKCSEDIQYKTSEMSGCLILISRCCNYASQTYGSANDLILQPYYDLFARLSRIINRCDRIPEWDGLMNAALECLSKLASDNVRLLNDFERFDTLGLVKKLLLRLGRAPEGVFRMCCETIQAVASSLRNDYLKNALPHLREPLAAVPRRHPQLLENVRSASWEVMKCIIDLEKAKAKAEENSKKPSRGVDIDWQYSNFSTSNDSITNRRIHELLVNAGLDSSLYDEMSVSAMNSARDSFGATDPGASFQASSLAAGSGSVNSPIKMNPSFVSQPDQPKLDTTGHLEEGDISHLRHHGDVAGTQFVCGPSSCGSLRQQDTPEDHGEWHGMSVADNHAHVQTLPILHHKSGRLPLTDLSPRGVTGKLEARKVHGGFVARKRDEALRSTAPGLSSPDKSLQELKSPIRRTHRGDNKEDSANKNNSSQGSGLNTRSLDLTLPKGAPVPLTGTLAKRKKPGKPTKKKQKKEEHSPVRAPMVIDISECPGFLESRPPVFKIKDDEAFIC